MSERIARSAGLNSLATLSSRLLGLVRDMVMAALFGAGMVNDAFLIASRVPNLVRDLFAEGAMSAAFVPTFTRYLKTHGKDAAWRLGNLVINALLVVTCTLVVLGLLFTEPMLRLLGDEFEAAADGEKLALTVQLARIVLPFLPMVAVAAALAGMLNALRRFFIPALSPALYNVAVILSAVTMVPLAVWMGWHPIVGFAVGTLLGGILQIVVQLPSLHREGFRYRPILSLKDPALREMLLLMGPGTIGVAAAQINLLVNTALAASIDGAVTSLQYAFRLMYLPIGLFGVAIATVSLPELARQATAGAFGEMRRTLSGSLRLMLMLCVPATVGLIALADPIVSLVYERGAFDSASSRATAAALIFYAPGIVGYSIVKIASPSFYALRDARTPVMVSLATIALNITLNLALVRVMGFQGLALGTAIASIFNATALLVLLGRRLDGLDQRRLLVAFVKILVASLAMGATAWGVSGWWTSVLPATWPHTLAAVVQVFGSIAAALVVLAAAAWALRLQEFMDAWTRVIGRLRG